MNYARAVEKAKEALADCVLEHAQELSDNLPTYIRNELEARLREWDEATQAFLASLPTTEE